VKNTATGVCWSYRGDGTPPNRRLTAYSIPTWTLAFYAGARVGGAW